MGILYLKNIKIIYYKKKLSKIKIEIRLYNNFLKIFMLLKSPYSKNFETQFAKNQKEAL
jgi:hypothetical protein